MTCCIASSIVYCRISQRIGRRLRHFNVSKSVCMGRVGALGALANNHVSLALMCGDIDCVILLSVLFFCFALVDLLDKHLTIVMFITRECPLHSKFHYYRQKTTIYISKQESWLFIRRSWLTNTFGWIFISKWASTWLWMSWKNACVPKYLLSSLLKTLNDEKYVWDWMTRYDDKLHVVRGLKQLADNKYIFFWKHPFVDNVNHTAE